MQTELDDLLKQAKELLKDEVTNIAYATWLQNIELVGKSGNTYIVKANSIFQKENLESKYKDLLINTFKFITNTNCDRK